MPSHSKTNSDYVFVRNKRTKEIDIRRANEFSSRPKSSTPLKDRVLHYIGLDRKVVCRCSDPKRHYEKTISVASESTHLNASLGLYMNRHDINSCKISDFKKFRERRKAQWAKQGVDVDMFHYAAKDKDIVCRCSKPGRHEFGKPRNPEIIEQCAEFFCGYKEMTKVTKEQWRRVDGDTPPAYSPNVESPDRDSPGSQSDSFHYHPVSPTRKMHKSGQRVNTASSSCQRSSLVPKLDEDIPSQVWQKARPSVCIPGYGTSSALSTPMGTEFPPTPSTPCPVPVKVSAAKRHVSMIPSRRDSTSTYWSQIQREAGGKGGDFGIPSSDPIAEMDSLANDIETMTIRELPNSFRTPPVSIAAAMADMPLLRADVFNPIVELPAHLSPTELPTEPPRGRNTPTLKKLEGRDWDTVSELEAKQHPASSGTSRSARKSIGLSSLFEQVLQTAGSSLPDQKEFFFQHAILTSRENPAPTASCQLCELPYQDERKRTIMLPDCGCFHHERCLIDNLRALDQDFGRCPTCHLTICVRTLADCINSDRQAIFGSQFTALRSEVFIVFPHRDEAVKCMSEEEVAIALYRLVKDYIDVHTEELFRLWEANRVEPDWYTSVVRPVVQLFQGWNPSTRNCFFPSSEVFLKLIAWAELVRLMNTTHVVTKLAQGQDALFPQLQQLHSKFALGRNRYELEKKTGRLDSAGAFDCDKIAFDAVRLAMETHVL
ncbi:hypothetical protein CFE70_009139 [Pyrenophora teres f. teres 0-1]|uniref:RING-type domain-containing protein n=1 Tax=Pyrenophora teres f. teres (strain 0-1) TaxID=861557 RepID=E3S9T3_PYRTT|nr:hypothetical protein PTT_19827 [Pyrenophora teres f. teres 0-1]KAE8835189.1 hypothetical protein HRS9122_07459 [Pyrenophora teres f. teres]KAK1908974.1 hypothetical protein P3342_011050 [Pyrenophora teres f. teres]